MTEEPAARWEEVEAAVLGRRWGAPAVHLYRRVGSTNDMARRLAAEGSRAGTVVLAEEQVAGRGRAGRGWSSPAGLGLWFSVVALASEAAAVTTLPLRAGLAVARALDAVLGHTRVGIKWPNDLEVDGGKLGGVLCEAAWTGSSPGAVVVGVGLNLLHRQEDFPAEIRRRATSLRTVGGSTPSRLAVADHVVPAVVSVATVEDRLNERELAGRDLLRGRGVRVSDPMTGAVLLEGTADGIAADGALRVRTPERLRLVRSGTVRLLSDPAA